MKRLLLLFCFGIITHAAGCPPLNEYHKQTSLFRAKKHIFENTVYLRSLTPGLLIEALYYSGVKQPEIAYKQAIIETGWFTSELCTQGNNLFGMRLARLRATTAIGEYKYHAVYNHWYDSVKDYKLLQDWYEARGHGFDDYYKFLTTIGYATDKRYIEKLQNLKDCS